MIATLDELAQYVRQSVPDPKSMLHLKVNPKMGAVSFLEEGRIRVLFPEFLISRLASAGFLNGS